jgi:hypothetical protein
MVGKIWAPLTELCGRRHRGRRSTFWPRIEQRQDDAGPAMSSCTLFDIDAYQSVARFEIRSWGEAFDSPPVKKECALKGEKAPCRVALSHRNRRFAAGTGSGVRR